MANWAWPHTPASNWARIHLTGGPFSGVDAGHVPPDRPAPVQVVWSGWTGRALEAWLYEWDGATTFDAGRTDALIFTPVRRVDADEIPPAVATTDTDVAADPAQLIARAFEVPLSVIFPGI